jgi:hypothetical protein
MTTALWVLLIAFPLGIFWISSMEAAERATGFAMQLCAKANVQWLDQSVHQIKISIQRNDAGRIQWRRVYQYEYAHGQDDRYSATITMLGSKAVAWIEPISRA